MKVGRGTITVVGILILSLMAISLPGVPPIVVKIGRGILVYAIGVLVCFIACLLHSELQEEVESRPMSREDRWAGYMGEMMAILVMSALSWLGALLMILVILTDAVRIGRMAIERRRASKGE